MTQGDNGSNGSGGDKPENDARDQSERRDEGRVDRSAAPAGIAAPQPAPEPEYDPLEQYDPEVEFERVVDERGKIDEHLSNLTIPYADRFIHLFWWSAAAMVWTAILLPLITWLLWKPVFATGQVPGEVLVFLIVGWPLGLYLFLFTWRMALGRVHNRLNLTLIKIERYIKDKIPHGLSEHRALHTGGIKGLFAENSQESLLELLRLRTRSFHSWHRISIHGILIGIRMRPVLETNFISPRLFAYVAPFIAVLTFVVFHLGNAPREAGLWSGAGDEAFLGRIGEMTATLGGHFWNALWESKVPLEWLWGPGTDGQQVGIVPIVPVFAFGIAMSYVCFRNVTSIREYVVGQINDTLAAHNQLKPYSNDTSGDIIAMHRKHLAFFQHLVFFGRQRGGANPGFLREFLEDFKGKFGDVDFNLSEKGETNARKPAPNRHAETAPADPYARRKTPPAPYEAQDEDEW